MIDIVLCLAINDLERVLQKYRFGFVDTHQSAYGESEGKEGGCIPKYSLPSETLMRTIFSITFYLASSTWFEDIYNLLLIKMGN